MTKEYKHKIYKIKKAITMINLGGNYIARIFLNAKPNSNRVIMYIHFLLKLKQPILMNEYKARLLIFLVDGNKNYYNLLGKQVTKTTRKYPVQRTEDLRGRKFSKNFGAAFLSYSCFYPET